jgi:transcription antitermination factor NusG
MYSILVSTKEKVVLSKSEMNWFIFYTCPRAEKVVYNELMKRNFETYLPLVRTFQVWRNRQKKWVEKTLFPSYIFVYTHQYELYHISHIPKIVSLIKCAGKPSIVPQKDIDAIKKMLEMGLQVYTDTKLSKGEKVQIVSGPLMGNEGILITQKGRTRFGIRLNGINQTILFEVDCSVLKKI